MNTKHNLYSCVLTLSLLALTAAPSPAATRTWSGSGSGFWTNSANWVGSVAPTNGDGLVFPANAARLQMTNTAAGPSNLAFLSFTGSNYFLLSPSLSLTNGLTNAPAVTFSNTLAAPIATRANQTWSFASKTRCILLSNLNLATFDLSLDATGNLEVRGDVTGSAGSSVLKHGVGTVYLNGSGNSVPDFRVLAGPLSVNGVLSGSLSVSNGAVLGGNGTVGPFVCAGTVRPGDLSPGVLTISPGTASFLTGSILQFDLDGPAPGMEYDQLVVSSPPNLSGASLSVLPGFFPLVGQTFVVITNTDASAFTTTFAGRPEGSTYTVNNLRLNVSYVGGSGNDLTLTVAGYNNSGIMRIWSGAGTNDLWTTASNWVGNVAPNQGDNLVFPESAARLTNTNDFAAGWVFNSITISNAACQLNGNWIRLNAGVHSFLASTSALCRLPILLTQPQSFTNSGTVAMTFGGSITNAGRTLTFQTLAGETIFNNQARIEGAGLVAKEGSGRLTFFATTAFGSLEARAGETIVNGSTPLGSVTLVGGTLGGTGALGTITSTTGGTVSPGTSPGTLTCSNVAWNAGTTFFVELDGLTAGSQYDRLVVNGTVDLNNAALVFACSFKPPIGTSSFTILRNDSTNPVVGTFAGVPNGSLVRFGSLEAFVFYDGGDGNDIVISPRNNFVVWDGDAAAISTNWSTAANWLGDAPPASGDSILFPPGAPGLTNFNDLTNGFFLRTIRIDGSGYDIRGTNRLDVWDVAAGNTSGEVSFSPTLKALLNPFRFTNSPGGTLNLNGQIQNFSATVELNPGGTMVLNQPLNGFRKRGPGVLWLPVANPIPDYPNSVVIEEGTVQMLNDRSLGGAYVIVYPPARLELVSGRAVTNTLFCQGVLAASGAGSSNRYSGSILGGVTSVDVTSNCVLAVTGPYAPASSNGLVKIGAGSLYLQSGSGTTYPTFVNEGTLLVVITNKDSATQVSAGATLGGSGVVGPLTCDAGGVVAPGSGSAPTVLRASGSVTLQSGSTLRIQANSPALGSGYSQLRANGTVALNGATLDLTFTFTPALGSTFVIVSNESFSAISGAFAGLPEGTIFTNNSVALQITYQGGDGNDVTLTSVTGVPPPPSPVIPLSSGTYTQSFDSLALSGTANSWSNGYTLFGWYAAQSAAPFNLTSYRAADGSENAGALYSFGSAGNSERALGSLASGSPETIAFGLCFSNDTARSQGSFLISYTGEQWRSGGSGSVPNTLNFWYRVTAITLTNPEPGVVANWIAVTNLNFASPTVITNAGALDGNQTTNRQAFNAVPIPDLVVLPGQNVFFRWQDPNDGGADQGLAVDNLIVAFAAPTLRLTSVFANPTNNTIFLTGQGEASVTYGIESATNLTPPILWQRIGSNTANGTGLFQFLDTNAPPRSRFYRAAFP